MQLGQRRFRFQPSTNELSPSQHPLHSGRDHLPEHLGSGTAGELGVLRADGLELIASTQEEFSAHLKKESDKWGKVIRERRMRVE